MEVKKKKKAFVEEDSKRKTAVIFRCLGKRVATPSLLDKEDQEKIRELANSIGKISLEPYLNLDYLSSTLNEADEQGKRDYIDFLNRVMISSIEVPVYQKLVNVLDAIALDEHMGYTITDEYVAEKLSNMAFIFTIRDIKNKALKTIPVRIFSTNVLKEVYEVYEFKKITDFKLANLHNGNSFSINYFYKTISARLVMRASERILKPHLISVLKDEIPFLEL